MKERPILFSAPMVRAILDGRKTVTRRVVKPQPTNGWSPETPPVFGRITSPHRTHGRFGVFIRRGVGSDFPETDLIPSPYGMPGDRLWVRETWDHDPAGHIATMSGEKISDFPAKTYYRADGGKPGMRWRPSIHMPRWASRILLEITAVRVERLQDISEEDAKAEGSPLELGELERTILGAKAKYRSGFCRLWQSINSQESWSANPWVWVIEFKRVSA